MVKVPRPREGRKTPGLGSSPWMERRRESWFPARGCSRGPAGHDLQASRRGQRGWGPKRCGRQWRGPGPSAAGARPGVPSPRHLRGRPDWPLSARAAPRANTAERRARVPPRPGSAGPSSGRAAGAGRQQRVAAAAGWWAAGRSTGATLCHADARWRRAPAPQLTRAAGRPQEPA